MSLQGELFPLISGQSLRAQLHQFEADFNQVEPEIRKDALWNLQGAIAYAQQLLAAYTAKARTTADYRQRQLVRQRLDAAFFAGHSSPSPARPPANTSPTLSLASSSTGNQSRRPIPGGRSCRPKWRRSSMESKPA